MADLTCNFSFEGFCKPNRTWCHQKDIASCFTRAEELLKQSTPCSYSRHCYAYEFDKCGKADYRDWCPIKNRIEGAKK